MVRVVTEPGSKVHEWYAILTVHFTSTVPEPEALQGLCGDVQGSSGVPQETQAGE